MSTISLRQAEAAARPWLARMARIGYTSKGAVYSIIGFVTAASAIGQGGEAGDQRAAVDFVLRQPFGRFVLLLLTIGLIGYALFRVIGTFADSEHHGRDAKGMAVRAGSFIRGALYGTFAWEVARLLTRNGDGPAGSDAKTRHWTARAMDQPFGRWLVAIGGACIIGYALYQISKAVRGKLSKQIRFDQVSARMRRRFVGISRFGIGARGIVFLIVGWSVLTAAMKHNPRAATGMSGALRELASQPFGSALLLTAGLGLISYGIYAMLNGKYRRG